MTVHAQYQDPETDGIHLFIICSRSYYDMTTRLAHGTKKKVY